MTFARLGVLGMTVFACACTPNGAPAGTPSPAERMRDATAALEHDDFAEATRQLGAVASLCTARNREAEALLLLAAVELDTANPHGSPRAAARFAERYLLVGDASDGSSIAARTLYRVAVHLVTLSGDSEAEASPGDNVALVDPDSCSPPPSGGVDRITDTMGSAAAPWLLDLEAERQTLRRRIRELEAELDRIDELLTSGATSKGSTLEP